MIISIQKRHLFFLGLMVIGWIMVVKNYQMAGKIMGAKNLHENIDQIDKVGNYVVVDFDSVLYMEYDGVYGGRDRRYAVYGTPDSTVYYVNGLDKTYILLELTNEKLIEEMDRGERDHRNILGKIYPCDIEVEEFLVQTDVKVDTVKEMVVRQVEHPERFIVKMLIGCGIIIFTIILFCLDGGIKSVVKRRIE